ncbi:MAG TPA: BatA domain-containing protein [Pirellulales bacterium]|nr:BatA domain-containing protein [Pirellulales bacterium]
MLVHSVILAFFNHPAMLGWLLAAAAPLIIHLLSRRRYRQTQWAAMQYLLAAVRKNSRRIRVEQWLLLAVRTLILVLVACALAEPYLRHAGITLLSGGRTHKVLALDASFSMACKTNDKTRFDRARELAQRIVSESSQGDGFTLVLLASPPRVVVGTPVFERRDFLDELANLRVLDGDADLPATLAKVEEILASARREYARLSREEVFFLTDLGRNTWMPDLRTPAAVGEFRDRSQRLASAATLVVADLGQDGVDNVAVTGLRPLESFVTLARDATLEAELHNFGRQNRERQHVELVVDGRRAGESQVDLPAGESAAVAFPYRFDGPGDHSVEVRATGDSLDVDNHRWLALPAVEHLRVLCVNGKPAGGDFRGATDYLVVALSPGGLTDERSVVRPEIVTERALSETDLDQYDCIFLCNVARFTPSESRLLESYVRGGGGLVIFLGDQVRAESYNSQLAAERDPFDGKPGRPNAARHDGQAKNAIGSQPGLLPAKLVELAPLARDEPYLFNPLGYRHPIVSPFRGRDRAGLLTAPTYEYFRLRPVESASTALAFANGDAAIVETRVGQGHSILVATSADASWTAWPMWPSYVPVAQELVAAAVRGRMEERRVQIGQTLSGAIANHLAETAVTIETPAGDHQSVRVETGDGALRWTFDGVDRSGFYRVDYGPPLVRQELFAANVDTAESDLARVSLDDLRDDVWPGVRFESFDGQVAAEEPTSSIVRRDALHHGLLYAALALMLFETSLASWLGGRAA